MVEWWLSLNIYEHIMLTVALASTIIVLGKALFNIFKFYSVDKLNSEPEDLEKYEKIANNDSDIERHVPRLMSVVGLNVFLMSTSWSYFIFILFFEKVWSIVLAITAGIFSMVIYAVIHFLIKKKIMSKNK